MRHPALIVHGGAGNWPDEEDADLPPFLHQAAAAGWAILRAGGAALDAVEAAVRVLEDAPPFDAGIGSFLNAEGYVEMDALIVEGHSGRLGAVAGVKRTRYPISLARKIMEQTPHVFIVGDSADALAAKFDLPLLPNLAFVTEKERARFLAKLPASKPGGTVGAVALDAAGHIAAATSTGGMANKMAGRVGDSPIFGAGGYADEFGGGSATGVGENSIRLLLCKDAVDRIASGLSAQAAAQAAMARAAQRYEASNLGIILVDAQGGVGAAHTTSKLSCAWINGETPEIRVTLVGGTAAR